MADDLEDADALDWEDVDREEIYVDDSEDEGDLLIALQSSAGAGAALCMMWSQHARHACMHT